MKTIRLLLTLLSLLFPVIALGKEPAEAKTLFRELPRAEIPDFDVPWATARSRCISFEPDSLRDLKPGFAHHFTVPAFKDRSFQIVLFGRERCGDSSIIWDGNVAGQPGSWVVAVWHKGVATISIGIPGQPALMLNPVYARDAAPGDPPSYLIREVNDQVPQSCGCGDTSDAPAPLEQNEAPIPKEQNDPPLPDPPSYQSPSNTWVDVAVFYTSVARAAAGSAAAIEGRALGINYVTNLAHANSDSKVRLRIVHLEEVAYDEAGDLEDHLNRLSSNNDGFMDIVHTRRDECGADLVHLLINDQGIEQGTNPDPTTVGYAQTPGAFGVTKWNAHDYVFAHEIGHNIGCRHEKDINGTPTTGYGRPYEITETWNFIFTTVVQTQRTIMWSSGSSASTIPLFSNPSRTWVMTGGSCGGLGDSGCTDVTREAGNASTADMARYIRENRSSSSDNKQPKFFLNVGGGAGEATKRNPDDNLFDVVNSGGWMELTEANPAENTDIHIAAGTYSGAITISKKVTLQKWTGGGNVVIGP